MINCFFENGSPAQNGLRHVTVGTIAVNDKNEVLLVRRAPHLTRPGLYTIPGGFLDRDETLTEGALRELKEESGYDGEIVALFHLNDNPQRPNEDRQNVDFVYIVRITGGEATLNSEVSEISWFDKEHLPGEDEFAFDHRAAIVKYFEYRQREFDLPLIGRLQV